MRSKVALVKLAAIGDVALACRAIKNFHASHEDRIDLHWIIDGGLEPVARAILGDIKVTFHTLNATLLFQGAAENKIRESLALLTTVARLQPDQLLLLHRDWRYRALLRPVFRGSLTAVTREALPELTAYEQLFEKLAKRLHIPKRITQPSARQRLLPNGRIGVLVGGARSHRVDFAEKRWPHFPELIRLLIARTNGTIVLFGGNDDIPAAETALAGLANNSRVENLVGKTSLENIPGILADLDTFISIDSGLAHIAAAVMTAKHQRVISLFGPTDPRVWAPTATEDASARLHYKARPCSPCYGNDGEFRPCKFEGEYFQHCMTDITAEEVFRSLS